MAVKKMVMALLSLVVHIHAGAQPPSTVKSPRTLNSANAPSASLEYDLLDHFNPVSVRGRLANRVKVSSTDADFEPPIGTAVVSQPMGMRFAGFKDKSQSQHLPGTQDSSTLVAEPNSPVLAVSGLAVVAMMVRRRRQS